MKKYNKILERLEKAGIDVKKSADIESDSATIISELLDRLEQSLERIDALEQNKRPPIFSGDLTPLQHQILEELIAKEVRFSTLAKKLSMEQNHLWNELDILSKLGLVEKRHYTRKCVVYTSTCAGIEYRALKMWYKWADSSAIIKAWITSIPVKTHIDRLSHLKGFCEHYSMTPEELLDSAKQKEDGKPTGLLDIKNKIVQYMARNWKKGCLKGTKMDIVAKCVIEYLTEELEDDIGICHASDRSLIATLRSFFAFYNLELEFTKE